MPLLGDIAEIDSRIGVDATIRWSVCASVCHVRTLFWNVFCIWQAKSLPYRVKIWLTSANPSKFWSKDSPPFELRAGDIRQQIVTMDSLLETNIALSNGTIAEPLQPPLSPESGSYEDQLRYACHLAIMIEDIDKIYFTYLMSIKRCCLLPNYFGSCL